MLLFFSCFCNHIRLLVRFFSRFRYYTMNVILWLTQSCLLSLAMFVLLGEELVLDQKHEDLLCTKVIRVAGENSKQYPSISQCCKLEKSSKWQIVFGILATVQISLLLVLSGLQSYGKSPWPFLSFVCVTCWILNLILLLSKVVVYLTPEHETVANSGFMSTPLSFVWNGLTGVFAVGFQRIFNFVAHLTSRSERREVMQNGLYFCAAENENDLRDAGANIPRTVVVLIVAYFISSGYTVCLVLAHEGNEQNEEENITLNRGTRQRRSRSKCGDQENDSSEKGEGRGNKTTEEATASRNRIRDVNRNKLTVAFVEESDDDDSFVFGWRL